MGTSCHSLFLLDPSSTTGRETDRFSIQRIRYQSLLTVIIYSEYSALFLHLEKKLAWVNRIKSKVVNSFNDDIEKEVPLNQSRHLLPLK